MGDVYGINVDNTENMTPEMHDYRENLLDSIMSAIVFDKQHSK
jgi:hypothetical protein